MSLKIVSCKRCGHEWPTKDEGKIRVCPKCHSPWWDRPRTITSVTNGKEIEKEKGEQHE